MLIRKMERRDYGAYCTLLREVHDMHAEGRPDIFKKEIALPEEDEFAEMIADEETVNLAADEGGEMIGMCLMEIRRPKNPIQHRKAFGWIGDLCVRSDCRGKGTGLALYSAMKDRARDMGLARIELMVWSFNEDAIRFYRRLGMGVRSYTMEERL